MRLVIMNDILHLKYFSVSINHLFRTDKVI